MLRPIYSISPFTLLDFPDHTACIIWFAGCNMRCPYCYNPEIVLGKGKLTIDEACQFLVSRKNLLQGVVFSGGECTLHPSLPKLVKATKEMGFLTKIDTNGSQPEVLSALLKENLIDYVALDYKALAQSYALVTHSNLHANFEKSLELLLQSNLHFEVRTTWHEALISTEELQAMVNYLTHKGYVGNYYIQHFVNNVLTLAPLPFSLLPSNSNDYSNDQIQVVFRRI